MRVPFATSPDDRDYLEPARSPLVPLSWLLAVVVAIVVVDVRLGGRMALLAAAFGAVSLATRLPRVLPVTAVLLLVIAGLGMLDAPGSASVVAAHAFMHATTGR
jgi:hypothetical protein